MSKLIEYKLTYEGATVSNVFNSDDVQNSPEVIDNVRTTVNGTAYRQTIGFKRGWIFNVVLAADDIRNFFLDAYNSSVQGNETVLSEQQDDGSFIDYTVLIDRPSYSRDTVGDNPLYRGISCAVREV